MQEGMESENKRLSPFQGGKRSKPSEKLESIRFKFFTLPPELRELVESEASKEGQEGMEWMANIGLKLQEKGLNRDQITKLFASQAPTVGDGSQRTLIDFLNSFLGPQEPTGDSSNHFRPTHKGNKNYVFSGTELQPLKNNSVVGDLKNSDLTDTELAALVEHQSKTGNLLDSDLAMSQNQDHINKEKFKNPPQFTPEELDSIRSTFPPFPEHSRALQYQTTGINPISSQPLAIGSKSCPLSRFAPQMPLIRHALICIGEYLLVFLLFRSHTTPDLSSLQISSLLALAALFLCTNYIYGFFQHQ